METFSIFLGLLFIAISLALLPLVRPSQGNNKRTGCQALPGPVALPIIGNIHQLGFIMAYIAPTLRRFHAHYGPIFRVYIGTQIVVFIANQKLAHQALVQMGAAMAGRPPSPPHACIMNSNQHSISTANHGPLWRLLRRTLVEQTHNPSRIKVFSEGRRWVKDVLINRLENEGERNGGVIMPKESFHYSIFCLLLFMCFGEKLDEVAVNKVRRMLYSLLDHKSLFNLLGMFPRLSKKLLWRQWRDLMAMRRNIDETLSPFIWARLAVEKEHRFCYVDALLTLEHPEGRRLTEGEMVTLCAEFLMAGTDTTSVVLQWVMANLVRNPKVQDMLYDEIISTVEDREEVAEDDLPRMPYLKAVILEALRRHPPAQLLIPHATTTEADVTIGGYHIPKNAILNFVVGDMGLDEKVWSNPMEFRPERFVPGGEGEDVDITGTKGVNIIPFGAGRRICPGMGLALLQLQYYVANLVRKFQWSVVEGEEVDLTETEEVLVVMKHPLRARITLRHPVGTSPCV